MFHFADCQLRALGTLRYRAKREVWVRWARLARFAVARMSTMPSLDMRLEVTDRLTPRQ